MRFRQRATLGVLGRPAFPAGAATPLRSGGPVAQKPILPGVPERRSLAPRGPVRNLAELRSGDYDPVMAPDVRGGSLSRWALIGLGVVVFAVRAKQARDAYVYEVSSGNKPIEGVATAVAAFVGLLPGEPINPAPPAR